MEPISQTLDTEKSNIRVQCIYLKLSDLRQIIIANRFNKIKSYELFAIDTIFIDYNLRLNNTENLVIISPVWIVIGGNRWINLNGNNGENHPEQNLESSRPGLPGRAGGSAGNFLGVAFEIKNSHMLKISTIGGNGGDGQSGARGNDGEMGSSNDIVPLGSKLGPNSGAYVFGAMGDVPAGPGGDGGAGGYGGYCGDMQLIIDSVSISQSLISIPTCGIGRKGKDGKAGPGGLGGRGGRYGDDTFYHCDFIHCTFQSKLKSNQYGRDSVNGSAGQYKYGMEHANVQTPAIDKVKAINNYKFILRGRLSECEQHWIAQQITNIYEKFKNQEISRFYDVNDFVDELIELETQSHQLSEIDWVDFYDFLFQRVQNYRSTVVNSNRTMIFLITAIFTRIHNLHGGFDKHLVININEYLKFIADNINQDLMPMVEGISQPLKQNHLDMATATYRKTITDRINEARTFITSLQHDVGKRLEEMKVKIN